MSKIYHYLALGDSYTIGEKVEPDVNFPNQVAALLGQDSIQCKVRIIAKTGWTTDELETGILSANLAEPLRSSYDFVSLLIGVNNQYRGKPVDSYIPEFEALVIKALGFVGNRLERVVILSIPDWGITPFAEGRDREQIAKEIDRYNEANRQIAERYHIYYINITPGTREASLDHALLAEDGLHPSGREYRRWAERIAAFFRSRI
jgi:lysophospholipase L1-like esterase